MIANHQPTIFGDALIAGVSSLSDGNMRFGRGDDELTGKNRANFFKKLAIEPNSTHVVTVDYETEDFARYRVVSSESPTDPLHSNPTSEPSDALVAKESGVGLFLPLGDCAGIIIYDPINHVLMVSHVGRHSAEIDGARTSVEYLVQHANSSPSDLLVWASPAVGQASYPIHAKNGRGLHEIISDQLLDSGVKQESIEVSPIDTAVCPDYFSHSEFKRGNRSDDGRFAIVAMLR